MVNVSVLVVLIFSQNFNTNGPYVVLNFCKFSVYMVLIFEKNLTLHTMYFRWVTIRQVSSLLGHFFQKNWDLSTFATRSLKVQKNLVLIF